MSSRPFAYIVGSIERLVLVRFVDQRVRILRVAAISGIAEVREAVSITKYKQ